MNFVKRHLELILLVQVDLNMVHYYSLIFHILHVLVIYDHYDPTI